MTHPVSGVVCDILSAQVTAEKDSVVLKSAFVGGGLTDVIFVENLDTPPLGVVCDYYAHESLPEKTW